ncbi:DUF222 domain-containing protein [Sphaerimonospora sp. CA-214678]|uniref:HNH endonuclease signature motif containing protein n=1 Tax=Sphaerimonospora sp. CA-214678 TaxID=3240029 RepID=UPI003D91AA8D
MDGALSWPLVSQVREAAVAVAVTVVPDAPEVCLAQVEELAFARDRLEAAIALRAGRVHAAGAARQGGHASTRTWLRSVCGMSRRTAYRTVALGIELARLPEVRARFASGNLAEGVVAAICAATTGLSDEDAAKAEAILLELADSAGPQEIAKAGRYLRAVLDPDGEIKDADADYDARFLLLRETDTGGVEGEFRLPREAAARLRALLDAYAKPRAQGDDRPLRVRNADALIALLEQQITTELLVLVNADSLPDDPPADGGSPPYGAASGSGASSDIRSGDNASEGSDCEFGTSDADASDDRARGDDVAEDCDVDGEESGDPPAGDLLCPGGDLEPLDFEDLSPDHGQVQDTGAGTGEEPIAGTVTGTGAGAGEGDDALNTPVSGAGTGSPQTGYDRTGHAAGRDGAGPGGTGQQTEPGTRPPDTPASADTGPGRYEPGTANRLADRDPTDHEPMVTEPMVTEPMVTEPMDAGRMDAGGAGARPIDTGDVGAGGGGFGAGDWRWQSVLRTLPGLLLSTGHLLPITDVHRLARTSTLVRLVMNAQGQVLDMGRKTRLATPAQRRAVQARYDTCWVKGCSLPVSMCQVDHLDNWSEGGRTDLARLGPACQFHNRDRYLHPDRYRRRQIGPDRWEFTYIGPSPTRKPRRA